MAGARGQQTEGSRNPRFSAACSLARPQRRSQRDRPAYTSAMIAGRYRTCARAHPPVIAEMRSGVAAYAEAVGAEPEACEAVRLAVSEAVTNVVLHAYREMEAG